MTWEPSDALEGTENDMQTTSTAYKTAAITCLPHRLEPWGMVGWTVREFASASDAADFFRRYPAAAMPCWRRMEVIDGQLVLVR